MGNWGSVPQITPQNVDEVAAHFHTSMRDQIYRGLQIELEHGSMFEDYVFDAATNITSDDIIATGRIAMAHLSKSEFYYDALEKSVENQSTEPAVLDDLFEGEPLFHTPLKMRGVVHWDAHRHAIVPPEYADRAIALLNMRRTDYVLQTVKSILAIEMEHGAAFQHKFTHADTNVTDDDFIMSMRIGFAHLVEGRNYYVALEEMEKTLM